MTEQAKPLEILPCARCEKRLELCVCKFIKPQNSPVRVIILQHPQEPDKDLGTARIAQLSLNNAELKVGLSWRSLKAVAGEKAESKDWGVLFLGSAKLRDEISKRSSALIPVTKKGEPIENPAAVIKKLKGLIYLDGTWSQAKALWWRNPWLTKLQRYVLNPDGRSLYSKARREPRKECLSTIEAVSQSLVAIDREVNSEQILKPFQELLKLYRERR